MWILLARRLFAFPLVLWATATLVFFALRALPGDPTHALFAEAGLSREEVSARRAQLNLDRPIAQQYLDYLVQAARGDLGRSYFTARPVTQTILEQAGPTLALAVSALAVGLALGLALGALASGPPPAAAIAEGLAALSLSSPVAWTGLLALWLAANLLRTPGAGLALPAAVIGFSLAGPVAGVLRASLANVSHERFLLAARARGVARLRLGWHAWRVALLPVTHLAALQAAYLFGGAVVTETVFARPGLGRLLVDSLLRQDFPVVQGLTLLTAAVYLAFNLAADLVSAWLDPRLRLDE